MRVRLRKEGSNNKKYVNYIVTIPKEILRKAPRFKRQKFVEVELDLLGHITVKAE